MREPRSAAGKLRRGKQLLASLRDICGGLPTMEEKARASEALQTLANFLHDAHDQLKRVPTLEDTVALRHTIDALDRLLTSAEHNPTLAAALGLEVSRRAPARPAPPSAVVDIQSVLHRFAESTIDQIREMLNADQSFTISQIRTLARSLGIPGSSKTSRSTLANQIVVKLSNVRGYQMLSSSEISNESPVSSEHPADSAAS